LGPYSNATYKGNIKHGATSNMGYHHIPNSCMDLLMNGQHSNGYYQISGAGEQTWTVCRDFNSEPGSVWTLVMSYSFEYFELPAFKSKSLTLDVPVNELSPNWEVYRVSKGQMNFLRAKSTHWRATCQFVVVDVDYKDYVWGNFAVLDSTKFQGVNTCKTVDYINIRGNVGAQTTAVFWQLVDHYGLHAASGVYTCDFKSRPEQEDHEDNSGYNFPSSDAFRCTSNLNATTQGWFGSYIF